MNQPVMDHWTTVKRIHQAALDVDPSERAAFVDESCGENEALRREVESLLTYATEAEAFLERPAADIATAPSSESYETTLVGRTISHYQVRSLLGAGGMGEVYLACDSRLDRTVALKILPRELAADPERMQRFAREAKAASALNHPNVATIYDIGESDGIRFIVMEHVEGETIAGRIGRPLRPSEVVDIAVQAADALDVAHAKGITHRDIKPANLMLTHRGHVKVLDFGVAKVNCEEVIPNGDWTVEPVTAVGSVVGSGPYMSPEQILGGDVDPRSDVFSLGVVIYQMATGQHPFSGSTREELTDHILHTAPEPMRRLNPALPSELERVTIKCLDKRPEDRYQSARELLTDLWPLKRQLDANAAGAMPDAVRFELLRRAGSHPGAAAKLAVADDASITDAPRPSEASELVARGWAHLRSGSFFETSEAVSAFKAATELDPTFAAAYAGLALAKVAQATNRNGLVEAFREARAAALRALALDDESPDARAALGEVMLFAEWDWIAAERSFQRALAIDPNHAHAYLRYGDLMEALGDLERGFDLKLQGLECDSTSVLAHLLIAVSCWNQRRYADMIVWANKALDRDPQHHFARELLGGAYWKLGDLERAGQLLRANSSPVSSDGTTQPELGNDVTGGEDAADYGAEFRLVMHHASAGDLDAAFEHLHRLIDARDPALIHLAVAPQWDSLRADPRFNECLARMKLRPVL
ncbi:MAG TPA: protein kinase [Vicinamibacterales bacterium]|nr:protein kinase [Vicinamibacterales bacterium]